MNKPSAANPPYRMPPRLFDARCRACWFTLGIALLVLPGVFTARIVTRQ